MTEVIIKDDVLRKAAGEGMDAFVGTFVAAIKEAIGGQLTAENMGDFIFNCRAWGDLSRCVLVIIGCRWGWAWS